MIRWIRIIIIRMIIRIGIRRIECELCGCSSGSSSGGNGMSGKCGWYDRGCWRSRGTMGHEWCRRGGCCSMSVSRVHSMEWRW